MSCLMVIYCHSRSIALFLGVLAFLLSGVFDVTDCLAKKSDLSYEEQKALYEAQEKLKKDDPSGAISILKSYITEHEDEISAKTYLLLGNCWFEKNRSSKAREAYSRGLDIEPRNTVLLLNYAISCYASEKYHQAGQSFKKLYQIGKDPDPEYLYRSGAAFFQSKDYEEAQNVLEKLLKIQGNDIQPKWVELLIHTSVRQKDWDAAKMWLYRILEDKPRDNQYWKLLAQVYLHQGEYRQAASALEIAYTYHPPKSAAWEELASIYSYLNLPLKAAESLDKAYGQDKSGQQWVKMGKLYAHAYRYEKAIDCFEKAIKIKPTASLYLKKGRLCYQAGFYKRAIDALEKTLDLNPEQGEAFILLGYAAWQRKDWELARSAFDAARGFPKYRQQAKDSINSLEFVIQAERSSAKEQSVNS